MLDKWLIDIALKGFPKCHKSARFVAPSDRHFHCPECSYRRLYVKCLMADENANSAGRNLHLDFRGIDCQGT